jgi:hypothetical protein
MIGLYLAVVNWEKTFNSAFRDPNSTDLRTKRLYTALNDFLLGMIMVTTAINVIINYYKHTTKRVWLEYKDPIAFYKKMV